MQVRKKKVRQDPSSENLKPFKNPKQLSFLTPHSLEFGGSLLLNKRKSQRILAFKKPIHLVLKGDIKKSGSLLKHRKTITDQIEKWANKFSIEIYNFAVEFNHIHFSAKLSSRENYNKFIKALTGRLAQLINFKFILRPYTKIVNWGCHFKNLFNYVTQNHEEATGQRPYKPRKDRQKTNLIKKTVQIT